jgi:hypothetical protein
VFPCSAWLYTEDGLLYDWTLEGAPQGSNAWRRLFNGANATEKAERFSPEGYPFLHAVAAESEPTPYVDNPHYFVAGQGGDQGTALDRCWIDQPSNELSLWWRKLNNCITKDSRATRDKET